MFEKFTFPLVLTSQNGKVKSTLAAGITLLQEFTLPLDPFLPIARVPRNATIVLETI